MKERTPKIYLGDILLTISLNLDFAFPIPNLFIMKVKP